MRDRHVDTLLQAWQTTWDSTVDILKGVYRHTTLGMDECLNTPKRTILLAQRRIQIQWFIGIEMHLVTLYSWPTEASGHCTSDLQREVYTHGQVSKRTVLQAWRVPYHIKPQACPERSISRHCTIGLESGRHWTAGMKELFKTQCTVDMETRM
jgi:hypothetical protein